MTGTNEWLPFSLIIISKTSFEAQLIKYIVKFEHIMEMTYEIVMVRVAEARGSGRPDEIGLGRASKMVTV